MKRLLYITLLFTTLLLSKEFSIIVDEPFNDALFDVTQDYDRTISAVGFSRSYDNSKTSKKSYSNAFDYLSSINSQFGSGMHILKVDKKANLLIHKSIKLSSLSEAVAVVKSGNNGYILGGHTLDGSLVILKLGSDGSRHFLKLFGTKNYDRMKNLIQLSDGGILAIGSSTTSRELSDNKFNNGLGLRDIFLTRFSKNGKILWSKKFGTEKDDEAIDAVESNDGSIIVVGTTSDQSKKNISLMRLSQSGDKIWLKSYSEFNQATPHRVIKLRDGNFLLSLTQRDDSNKKQIRVVKFDLQKSILIDAQLETSYSSALLDIKEFSNGNIMGVGFVKDSYNTDALIVVLNSELKLINQEHYGTPNYDILNGVTITHDSKAVAVGINTAKNSEESNMWILKVNSDGTLLHIEDDLAITATSSTKKKAIKEELREMFSDEIDKKELTIINDYTLHVASKSLYFDIGKYILTAPQKKFLDTLSIKLIKFLVKNKKHIKSLEINGHTSSEWGSLKFDDSYIKNSKLSMNRSYSTLSYIFNKQDKKTKKYLIQILRGSGYSYSKPILKASVENREKSRRVSFKIILN